VDIKAASSKGQEVLGGQLGLEAMGIACLAVGLLVLVFLVLGEAGGTTAGSIGVIGLKASKWLKWLMGYAVFVLPAALGYAGILMLIRKKGYFGSLRLLALVGLVASSAAIAAIIGGEYGEYGKAGGAMGGFLASVPAGLIGHIGSGILHTAVALICLVVLSNIPLSIAATFVFACFWYGLISLWKLVVIGYKSLVLKLLEQPADKAEQGSQSKGLDYTGSQTAETPSITFAPTAEQGHDLTHKDPTEESSPAVPQRREPRQKRLEEWRKPEQTLQGRAGHLPLLPPLSILGVPIQRKKVKGDSYDVIEMSKTLEATLNSFGVSAKVVSVSQGPTVTRFEVQPSSGVKVARIASLVDDIALAFAAPGIRIEAPIPGKAAVGVEIPNRDKGFVYFREVLETEAYQKAEGRLIVALGKDIAGNAIVVDLTDILHLLVAGSTGSGKSVCLNTIIASLLFRATPEDVRLLMIDPKRVELSVYNGIPHLIAPVVTDPKKAAGYLKWVCEEMENRYRIFQIAGARNISQYNEMLEKGMLEQIIDGDSVIGADQEAGTFNPRRLPYIVVILDELADLMMVAKNDVEDAICRLAFMARAAGIHLILATQRPSVDIVTGIIKANIPSRIAFAVSSQIDSRVILDTPGAERLLGKGDMLFHPVGLPKPIRIQGAYISDSEVLALVDFLKGQGEPVYVAKPLETKDSGSESAEVTDDLFEDAARLIIESGEASISKIQRRYRVGYARAARLIDTMELMGIIGPHNGSKSRNILMSPVQLEEFIRGLREEE
jgi:S-DNA-T family DNA segregation ATPase FtsK/SpoIIIE